MFCYDDGCWAQVGNKVYVLIYITILKTFDKSVLKKFGDLTNLKKKTEQQKTIQKKETQIKIISEEN